MPRASSNPTGPVLRRNQACRTCRKKKLKCDAQRPYCGACRKAWEGLTAVPPPDGYAHPPEPQCSYDPIEGLTLAESINPAEKIRELEEQVSMLKKKLQENGVNDSPGPTHNTINGFQHSMSSYRVSSLAPPHYPVTVPSENWISLPKAGLNVAATLDVPSPPSSRSITSSPDNSINSFASMQQRGPVDLMMLGYDADLPPPLELMRHVKAFFDYDPCGTRMLDRASFMMSLNYEPRDPRFPHPALLHAICAAASRWTMPDTRIVASGIRRCEFADYHAAKTRQYIDKTMASGADIFSVLQACSILSWFFYTEGRWVETYSMHGSTSPGAYILPPKNRKDLEMRRRTWWMSVVFDRLVSVGGWIHGIEKGRVMTELPLRRVDYEAGGLLPEDNPQNMQQPDFYTNHPIEYTDSFILFIKAVMLFGLVTDINTDYTLSNPESPKRTEDPFVRPGFTELDKLAAEDFLQSLPVEFKQTIMPAPFNIHLADEYLIDTDLYLVHMVPHGATITLHNPYINFDDPDSKSTRRCVTAADAILEAHIELFRYEPDPEQHKLQLRLHPFIVILWYLAAVVKVQQCKFMIERGDTEGEVKTWGEINLLRFAMIEFGQLSPIGVRQEKLLKTLMASVVNLTQHENPLDVKLQLPLYVFSRASAFEGANGASMPASGIAAPLPDALSEGSNVPQQDISSLMGNGSNGYNGVHSMNGMNGGSPGFTSMHNGVNYGSPQNGMWDATAQYISPSPPSYPSGGGAYMH